MVRIKYRYISIQIKTSPSKIISQESYKRMIYDSVYESHGISVSAFLHNLSIIDTYSESNICIFRVLSRISNQVKKSMLECKRMGGLGIDIQIIAISGSIRGANKQTLAAMKKQITN